MFVYLRGARLRKEPTERTRRHFFDDQNAAVVCRPRGDEVPVRELTGLVQRGLEKFPTVTPPVVGDKGPRFIAHPEHECATIFRSGRYANGIGFGDNV